MTNTGTDIIASLAQQTALGGPFPLSLVEKVAAFQFRSAAEATRTCSSVELSGIGYLYCSSRKTTSKLRRARQILSSYLSQLDAPLSPVRLMSLRRRIESVQSTIYNYEDRLERSRTGYL